MRSRSDHVVVGIVVQTGRRLDQVRIGCACRAERGGGGEAKQGEQTAQATAASAIIATRCVEELTEEAS